MFTLTPAHEAAFKRGQREAFIEELAHASYDFLPDDAPFLNPAGRLKGADLVLRTAEAQGYSTRGGLFFWLNVASILGSHFHSDPQYAALRPPPRRLGDPDEPRMLAELYTALSDYIAKVHGGRDNDTYTDAALRFAAMFDNGARPGCDDDVDGVGRALSGLYPQKFQRHSDTYLQKLHAGVYKDKAQSLLASQDPADIFLVAGVEMFLGHRFETDVFKPWIGETLAKSKPQAAGGAPDLQDFFTLFRQWVDPADPD